MKQKPRAPQAPEPPYTVYPATAKQRKRRSLRWVLLAVGILVVIVAAIGGGSYIWLSRQVHSANSRVDQATRDELATKPENPVVSVPEAPGALDVLLVGSDSRNQENEPGTGRSDTIILLHIDQNANYMSMLSVPRDLYVDIPGHGKNKINAAYAYGGSALAIKTVKQLTGVDITKYVEVDFTAFEDIVNSIGGVYVDVDRLYSAVPLWHNHIDAGYQLLDGQTALLYARYREDRNLDFGRMVRQQRLIQAIKEQTSGWDLTTKLPGLVTAGFKNLATNFGTQEVINLALWFSKLDNGRIRQISITGTTPNVGTMSVVMASTDAIRDAVTKLLTPPTASSSESSSTSSTSTSLSAGSAASSSVSEGLSPDLATARPVALATTSASADTANWTSIQAGVPFTLEKPGYLPPGFTYSQKMPQGSGTYGIKVGNSTKPAVKVMYRYKTADLYLGISATTWLDAPLASKGTEVKSNGVTYTVVGSASKVDHIWWKQGGVLYFLSNTLMYTLNEQQLLKVAESMGPVAATR